VSTRLEVLIQRARDVGVRDDHARVYVGELARWGAAAPVRPRRTWVPWLAGAFAIAVLIVVVVAPRVVPRRGTVAGPLALGDRVAIVAEPNTTYRVARATADETVVDVERGTLTARLWPGESVHRLVLRGGAIEAVATGTVYSLTVDERGASVAVHEGSVAVTGAETATVRPGQPWPASAVVHGAASARRLLAVARPAAAVPASVVDGPPDVVSEARLPDAAAPGFDAMSDLPRPDATSAVAVWDAGAVDALVVVDAMPSLPERWRLARLYRGQASYDAAIRECIAIADAKDKTWSPIALVEAMRIELGPLTSPERALVLADRFAREWPNHDLAADARELRCRALRQLGRAAECTPK
jgi:hypothetical protein